MTRRIISDVGWVAARYIRTNEQIRGLDTVPDERMADTTRGRWVLRNLLRSAEAGRYGAHREADSGRNFNPAAIRQKKEDNRDR